VWKRGIVFVGVLMLFILFGCIAPGLNRIPCCERESAMKNGECYLQSSDPSISTNPNDYCSGCSLLYCAFAEIDPSTNETKYYKISNGAKQELNCNDLSEDEFNDPLHPCNNIGFCVYSNGNGNHVAFPICSERPRYPCEQPNCTSMFCGELKYAPRKTFLPQTGFDAALQPIEAEFPQGLYHASCNFYELTHENIRKIKKSTNIFQNSFRFGVGTNINDFEEARWYFPVSDYFTTSSTDIATLHLTVKDRFANYLRVKKNVFDSYDPSSFFNRSFCARDYWLFPPLAIPGLFQNYNFSMFIEINDSDLNILLPRILINPDFYKQHLMEVYWSSISNNPSEAAEFECLENGDCVSNICSKDPDFGYARGVCEKIDGTLVNCLCYEKGMRGFDAQVECYPVRASNKRYIQLMATVVEGNTSLQSGFSCTYPTISLDFFTSDSFSIPADSLFDAGISWPNITYAGSMYSSAYQSAPLASDEVCLDDAGFHVESVQIYRVETAGSHQYTLPDGTTCSVTTYATVPDHVDQWIVCGSEKVVKHTSTYCTSYDSCSGCKGYGTYVSSSSIPSPDSNYHGIKETKSITEKMCAQTLEDNQEITYYEIPGTTDDRTPINNWCCDNKDDDGSYGQCVIGDIPSYLCDRYNFNYGAASSIIAIPNTSSTYLYTFAIDCDAAGSNNYVCSFNSNSGQGDESSSEYQVPSPPIIFFEEPMDGYIGYSVADDFPYSAFAVNCGISENDYDNETITEPFFYDDVSDIKKLACLEWEYIPDEKRGGEKRLGCVKYYKYLYKIKSLGECKPDDGQGVVPGYAIPSFPKIAKLFGWCEPKGFVTMVRVNLENVVNSYSATSHSIPVEDTWSGSDGFGPVFGLDKKQGKLLNQFVYDVRLFRNRIDHYLKSNVMPVVWYPHGELFGSVSSEDKYKVADDVKNAPGKMDEANKALEEVLTSNFFLYVPDMEPFFTSAEGHCEAKKEKVYKRDGDYEVIRASNYPNDETSLWKKTAYDVYCSWTASFPILKRFIGNSASLVIISTGGSPNNDRVEQGRRQCERCLFAHYSDDPTTYLAYPEAWYDYDVLVWPYTISGNIPDVGDSTKYEDAFLTDLKTKAESVLKETGKPSLVIVRVSRSNSGKFNQEDAFRVFSHLLRNKNELIHAGIIGFIYGDWGGSSDYILVSNAGFSKKDDHFCAIEQSVDLYLVPMVKREIFVQVPAQSNFGEEGRPKCVACDPMLNRSDACNTTCINMDENGHPIECIPDPNIDEKQMCPFDTVVNSDAFKCADCMSLLLQGKEIKCTRYYDNGSTETIIYAYSCDGNSIGKCVEMKDPSLFPDVIGSLPRGEHCCIFDENIGNYTYVSYGASSLRPDLIVFPTRGNKNAECGPVSDRHEFCGVELPARDYSMNCSWVK
jgi:hypothetical protein